MPLVILLIVGTLSLLVSGMWLGTIAVDMTDGHTTQFRQYFWALFCLLFGLYAIIACIGHVADVK